MTAHRRADPALPVGPSAPEVCDWGPQVERRGLLLVRDFGVPLIEGMVLDELAEAGGGAFLLLEAPQPAVGGTAGPVCPVAVL